MSPSATAVSTPPEEDRISELGDDVLSMILARIVNPKDRSSISLVAKQWLRLEGLTRSTLLVIEPDRMPNFLSRFPNIYTFGSTTDFVDAHVQLLAESCLKLETLALDLQIRGYGFDKIGKLTDAGLCAIAKSWRNLSRVSLRDRKGVGDEGIIRLVEGCANLNYMDLTRCSRITDQSLASLKIASRLEFLNLKGCTLITDNGLMSLASGPLQKTLKCLVLCECDRITDLGVTALRSFSHLEELNLADCGPEITDIGGEAISCITSLRRLDMSWLINIGDATLQLLAGTCKRLEKLVITGCEELTGNGISCFASHPSLETLLMASCLHILPWVVRNLVVTCRSLKLVHLDRKLRFLFDSELGDCHSFLCRIVWI